MSQQAISRFENEINNDKQTLSHLEQQKSMILREFTTKKQELITASERAVNMPTPGPLMMSLIRQSVEIEQKFLQDESRLENDISNVKRNIERKQQQLDQLKRNFQANVWSPTFK
jgi:hypothetical protein